MNKLKYATREEHNNFHSSYLIKYLTKDKQLPDNATKFARGSMGTWYRVQLPAGVTAIAYHGIHGHHVGYYHSPSAVELEIKALTNAFKRRKATR